MPMGALAGAALSGRGVTPAPVPAATMAAPAAPAPAPAPTMAAQPTAQPNATYQPAPMAPQPARRFQRNQAAAGALQAQSAVRSVPCKIHCKSARMPIRTLAK